MRRILAALVPAVLLLSACGSSDSGPSSQSAGDTSKLSTVKVTDQGSDKAPKVEFAKPLSVTEPTIKMIHDGSGDKVKANQRVEVGLVVYNGKDGSQLADDYVSNHQQVALNDSMKSGNAPLYNAMVGAKVGSDLVYALPPDASSNAPATQLYILHLFKAQDITPPLSKPEGDTVTPPAGLPKVTTDSKGVPQIDIKGADKPKSVVSQDLIKGKGAPVEASDTVVVNYVGVNLSDGVKFDSSFDSGQPLVKPLSSLIPGWAKGLTGKTVGSRVLLVIPATDAYGDQGQGKAKGDLVFVVDILGVQ
ncbi:MULTISPECIES: FKBP-type peptidyl-prolyl cis-trans isomerase [Arthrobacter]|uniref:Peptidyl-prolyl cis-trans isomerase n=2 Tax=Arthrobacter TaxID=1663 RepID=A0ABU9KHU8_9MICC|nr:FKBP-type peptidyl-prolyl cis-trans isomerase [Arthrobacter sp. YJM1]MDP5225949.1 FKBP-type peptidyl-prolyl cis-trans isomerase [Arthrobacter sp. YJM1]